MASCCCGCTLKTSTVIIGAIHLVSSVLVMITAVLFMTSPDAIMSYLNNVVPGWKEDIDTSSMRIQIMIVAGCVLAAGIFAAVISSCLLHGARTANKCLVKPWIVLTAISLALDICKIIQSFFTLIIIDIIGSVLAWVITTYFFMVVWSYKDQVESGNTFGVLFTTAMRSRRSSQLEELEKSTMSLCVGLVFEPTYYSLQLNYQKNKCLPSLLLPLYSLSCLSTLPI